MVPGLSEILVIFPVVVASALLLIWPAARICRRIGFSPWLGALAIVPVANLLLLWFVAVAQWPSGPVTERG